MEASTAAASSSGAAKHSWVERTRRGMERATTDHVRSNKYRNLVNRYTNSKASQDKVVTDSDQDEMFEARQHFFLARCEKGLAVLEFQTAVDKYSWISG